jgi:pimeloyl-ACP methyl ester carboxylesterase
MFEAGMADSGDAWRHVAPAVAGFARTVVYDRAGYGASDDAPERDVESLLRDHLVVRRAAAPGSCVLVGHSYGGLIARMSAVREPSGVEGVLLVDEVSEFSDDIVDGRAMRGAETMYRYRVLAARVGLLSRLGRRESTRADGSVRAATTAQREWRAFLASMRHARNTGPWVPYETAVTSISTRRSVDNPLNKAHAELVALFPGGRHVVAATRSHRIHEQQPDLVIDEIRRLTPGAPGADRNPG